MQRINSFAVCMTGEPRTALSTVVTESFQKRVLNVLRSTGATVDVHMTSVFGQGSKAGSSSSAPLIAALEKQYQPSSHGIMNASNTWRVFANFSCPHGVARFGHNSQGSIHSWRNAELVLVQWVAIRACYEQVEAHERASGSRYAWIMRTRYDLAYLVDLPVAQLSPSSVFIPFGLVPCHNDHLFLCPREMCRPYFTLLELFESKHCVRQLATAAPGAPPSLLRGPFASGDPLLPHGTAGPPAEPFALPEQPNGVDQQWYVLARYSRSGRVCGAGDVLPECCGAPLLTLLEWPYAIARGSTASGYLENCGTLGVATSGRDINQESTPSRPWVQQAYTSARLPPHIELRVAAMYQSVRAEGDALASRWHGPIKRKEYHHTAYSMNLAGKLTPQDSPGDDLFTAWRCADYTPAQWWRKACKKWYET